MLTKESWSHSKHCWIEMYNVDKEHIVFCSVFYATSSTGHVSLITLGGTSNSAAPQETKCTTYCNGSYDKERQSKISCRVPSDLNIAVGKKSIQKPEESAISKLKRIPKNPKSLSHTRSYRKPAKTADTHSRISSAPKIDRTEREREIFSSSSCTRNGNIRVLQPDQNAKRS